MSDTIDSLQIEINARASKANDSIDRLVGKLDRLTSSLTKIEGNKLTSFANGVQNLSRSMQSMNNIKTADFTRLAKNMQKLNDVDVSKLSTLSKSFNDVSASFKRLNGISQGAKEITELANGIKQLGYTSADKAIKNIPLLATSMKHLMQELSTAPKVSQNIIDMTNALAKLARTGASSGKAANSIINTYSKMPPVFGRIKGSLNNLTNSFGRFNNGGKNFAKNMGLFYVKALAAVRGFQKLWGSIESGADYVETYNYFKSAWNQVADNADLSQWKEFGYKSAEEYANSFSERAKQLTQKLSGYIISTDGSLASTGDKNLGIDPNMIMNYQAQFGQMSSSMGVASENAVKLSSALSRIGLDLASVKNLNFTDTLDDLSSGLTGQSRVLDKYGINIRVAAMNEMLMKLGIDATARSLGQADKALLRTIMILDSSRYAWADLSETINAPSNQLRLLSANLNNASRMFGSLFLPIVKAVLPYLNAMAIVLNRFLEYLGKLVGLDFTDIASNTEAPQIYSDIADSAEDAADAQDKASNSAKKWKNQLMSFDKINKLNEKDTSDAGATKGNGIGPNGALQDALDKMLDEYDKAWNKAYNDMENKSGDLATRLQKALIKAWNMADGAPLGKAIAKWLNKGLSYANNNIGKYGAGAKRLAKVLGTTINGFVETYNWKGLGSAVGNGIKATLEAERTFFKTVNWANLGKSISKTLNSFFETGVFVSYLGLAGDKLRAAIQTAFGAIKNFDFALLGEQVGKGINEFFASMSKVDKDTGLTGWQELGQSIAKSISGILVAINTALDTLDWEQIGVSLGDFLSSIEWDGILEKAIKVISKSIFGLLKIEIESFKKAPLETAFATFIGGITLTGAGKKFAKIFMSSSSKAITKTLAKNTIFKTLISVMTMDVATVFGAGTFAEIGLAIFGGITGAIAAAFVGWKLGKLIYESMPKNENGDNFIDKIVEKSGIGKIATKIADFFEFELPEKYNEAAAWMGRIVAGLVSKMPSWMKKILKIDESGGGGGSQFNASVEVDANTTKAGDAISKVESNNGKGYKTSINVNAKQTKSGKEIFNAVNALNSKTLSPKIEIKTKNPISSIAKQWAKDFENNFKPKWNITLKNGKSGTVTQTLNMAYFTAAKANGGIYRNGKWSPIQQYAVGGIPNQGQMFIAREKGPELVGNLGGHTAVMNNDQIVSSVSAGVYEAVSVVMANAVTEVVNAINTNGNGDIYLDRSKVTDEILKDLHLRKLASNGVNPVLAI